MVDEWEAWVVRTYKVKKKDYKMLTVASISAASAHRPSPSRHVPAQKWYTLTSDAVTCKLASVATEASSPPLAAMAAGLPPRPPPLT